MKEKTIALYAYQELKDVSPGLAGRAIQKVRTSDWWVERVLRKYLSDAVNKIFEKETLFTVLPEVNHQIFIGDDYFPDDVEIFSVDIPLQWLNMKKYYNRWAMRNLSEDGKITQDKLITDGDALDRFITSHHYNFKFVYESGKMRLEIEDSVARNHKEATLKAGAKVTAGQGNKLKFGDNNDYTEQTPQTAWFDANIIHKDKTHSNVVFTLNYDPNQVAGWFTWLEEFFVERLSDFIGNLSRVLKYSAYLVYSDKFVEEFCQMNSVYFSEDGDVEEYTFGQEYPEEETIEIVAPETPAPQPGQLSPQEIAAEATRRSIDQQTRDHQSKRLKALESNFTVIMTNISGISKEIAELPTLVENMEKTTLEKVNSLVEEKLKNAVVEIVDDEPKVKVEEPEEVPETLAHEEPVEEDIEEDELEGEEEEEEEVQTPSKRKKPGRPKKNNKK